MKNKLIRYTMQLAMLKQLLEKELISIDEYNIVKNKLMKDYNIISDITTWIVYYFEVLYIQQREYKKGGYIIYERSRNNKEEWSFRKSKKR